MPCISLLSLNIGVIIAVHQSWGRIPEPRELLKITVRHLERGFAVVFRILAWIWSGPDALFSFKLSNSFKTPSSVTVISDIVGDSGSSGSGMLLCASWLKTDLY